MEAIPWYKSKIIVGIAVSLVCKALALSGLIGEVTGDQQEELGTIIISLVGGAFDLWALTSRVGQTAAPVITSTATKAVVAHEEITAAKVAVAVAADVLDTEVPPWMR